MSKSATFSNDWLKLVFNATPIANLADNAASSPLTSLYVSLHTADPTDSGVQNASEITYTDYARQAVARTSGGWTVTGESVSPTADIEFPVCAGSGATATHFAVGTASSGGNKILYHGELTPDISITTGVTPVITTDTVIDEE